MPYENMTMAEARAAYFAENNFGADGGYNDSWLTVKFGPLPITIPNIPMRVDAVRYHDLHHIITGYPTDLTSEFEISAWELGSGCKNFPFAWIINLSGLSGCLLTAPDKAFDAFMRGRRSGTLYGRDLDEILQMRVEDIRQELALKNNAAPISPADVVSFSLLSLASIPAGLGVLVGGLLLTPLTGAVTLITQIQTPVRSE